MKHFILALFCVVFQLQVFSQKDYSVIREIDLKGKQFKAWNRFDTTWTKHILPGCLLENSLKLSCAHCSSVYLDVRLKIDSTGKLVSHEKVGGDMCGNDISDKVVKCFLDFFYFLEFPPELRNIILEVRLGSSLKC
jgi:hypothetical protein